MEQTNLFPESYDIEGNTLGSSHQRIYDVMKNGQWITLDELANLTGMTGSGASACMRNLRMPKFGSYIIERRHVEGRLYEYRLAGKKEEA